MPTAATGPKISGKIYNSDNTTTPSTTGIFIEVKDYAGNPVPSTPSPSTPTGQYIGSYSLQFNDPLPSANKRVKLMVSTYGGNYMTMIGWVNGAPQSGELKLDILLPDSPDPKPNIL
jgi:hypothetical protein